MQKTVFLNYTDGDGAAAAAFSVTLDSDPAVDADIYGVKRVDTGAIVVAADTAVDNPSLGRYEYALTVLSGVQYRVSWKIVPEDGAQPIYTSQQVGPFYSLADTKAAAEYRGTFSQGTYGTLGIRLYQIDG